MIPAVQPGGRSPRLMLVSASGDLGHGSRIDLGDLLKPGDLVVANTAATLPASLTGVHDRSGLPIEVRLAAWGTLGDPRRFVAVLFGAGDYRTRTEDRAPPPPVRPGDGLSLGPMRATLEQCLDHPRLASLRFDGGHDVILAGIAAHGRPVQYAHVPKPLALWDVWTAVAGRPLAFEPPSAGFALDWRTVTRWRERGVGFATLEHAAGLSSTGDAELDRRLPLDEGYAIPDTTAAAIAATRRRGGRIAAIGTTVVRALEAAADADGTVRAGSGVATGRITARSPIRVVDAILSGVHAPGESHYELLGAFADADTLWGMTNALAKAGYRSHEFGDFVLIERKLGGETIAA
ncbi:S-adenosylmethionine:tRNA ribosyltransferase-isomerase [Bauldia sp.]|uniref:S-adenosylmethionine:tRNA ribosyltransferase-isomerase n=1 Tax=Bauldia sp. TaxID=2575872 RepID=UPI003BA85CEF